MDRIKGVRRAVLVAITAVLVGSCTHGVLNLSAGPGFFKTITVNNGAVIGSNGLINFPMLFSYTDPDLRDVANGGDVLSPTGTDIYFTGTSGVLNYEIESYDPVAGTLIAWVSVPQLLPPGNEAINLVFGGAEPQTPGTTAGVWQADYLGVWHFDGIDNGGGIVTVPDSTSNNNAASGSATLVPTGMIGGAVDFNGFSDVLQILSAPAIFDFEGEFTLSCWVRLDKASVNQQQNARLIDRYLGGTGGYDLAFDGGNPVSGLGITVSNGPTAAAEAVFDTATLTSNDWFYISASWQPQPGTETVWFDGTAAASTPSTSTEVFESGDVLSFGGDGPAHVSFLAGALDEVRIAHVARDNAWVAAEYANQSTPLSFYTVSGTQTNTPP